MSTQKNKLPAKVLASCAFYALSNNCMWMLNNYFLLFFYTDIIQIPSAAATVILLIARVWDAINDPMMGVLCDKTKSKEGKSRFWLGRVAIPAGVFVALSYFCPSWSTPGRIIWAGVAYILQGMAQTALGIPYSALIISIAPNRTDRVRIQQYTAIPSAMANFLIPALTMPFVRSFGDGHMRTGFFVLAAIIGTAYAIGSLCIYFSTKGMDPDTSRTETAGERTDEPSALELIKAALQNKYCMLVTGGYMVYLLLSGIMGSTLIYYFRYYVGNENLMSVYSTTAVIGMLLAILIMRLISKKVGNAKTCIIGAALCVLAMIPRIITGDKILPVFAVCMVLLGAGSGFIAEMMHQCKMDAATYGKLHGADNPGVVVSIFTFAQKFGQAASSVIAAALLTVFCYKPGEEPTSAVLKLFFAENIIFPLVIAVILIFILLAVDKMEKQMVKDLAAAENSDN